MQTQAKRISINTRQMTLDMAALAVRALAAGLAVSIGVSLLIVAAIVLAS